MLKLGGESAAVRGVRALLRPARARMSRLPRTKAPNLQVHEDTAAGLLVIAELGRLGFQVNVKPVVGHRQRAAPLTSLGCHRLGTDFEVEGSLSFDKILQE
jgi:hypothetical protein